jgi:hypothetical protein
MARRRLDVREAAEVLGDSLIGCGQCAERREVRMRKVVLLIAVCMMMVLVVGGPAFAAKHHHHSLHWRCVHHHKHHCQKVVVKPEEPLPVTGTTENGSDVDGTLQDPTLTVDPDTGDGTISGDLNGTVTQPDGDVVQINDEQVTADVTVEQTEGCTIGYITLDGTLTVALLGLHLVVDQLDIQLKGFPDEGLLGNLLCGLAGGGSTTPTSPSTTPTSPI